jgi:hypothetical protein
VCVCVWLDSPAPPTKVADQVERRFFDLEITRHLQMQGVREVMSATPLLRFLDCQAWLALPVSLTHVRPKIQDAPNCMVIAP